MNEQLIVALVDGSWLVGTGNANPSMLTEDTIHLKDVWAVFHQAGLQPVPGGGAQMVSTPAFVMPMLAQPGPIAELWVRPTVVFSPENQGEWQARIEQAETATAEARTGLTLSRPQVGNPINLQGGKPRS